VRQDVSLRKESGMPRRIQIAIARERTDALLQELHPLSGVFSLSLQRNASLKPAGDLVTLDVANETLFAVLRLPTLGDLGRSDAVTVTTMEVASVVAPSALAAVSRGRSEASWEEIETTLAKESNMTLNALLVMALVGALAAIGIAFNTLHLVIAAMVIAPGFEPLTRSVLGAVNGNPLWRIGLRDTVLGYAALVVGAAVAAGVLAAAGHAPIATEPSYLPRVLMSYWTNPDLPSILASAVAGVAGALVIAMNRSLLTAGVMIALALVPTAAIVGMAIPFGETGLAAKAALRWAIDAALVLVTAWAVFLWKRSSVQKRDLFP
jgi:hypothetical protein